VQEARVLVLERILKLETAEGSAQIPIRVFLPRKLSVDWGCKFSIGWPEGEFEMDIHGVDAIQALDLALRTIGAFLYSSDHHASGELVWLEAGKGYGFPVPNSLRDMLIGDDQKFL
jgi:hypothetical protein